jgi:hypothetical protein
MTWRDAALWKDDDHFRIACALAHELAVAGLQYLDELGSLLISADSVVAED